MSRVVTGKFYCHKCQKIVWEVERFEDEYGRGFDQCCICTYPV